MTFSINFKDLHISSFGETLDISNLNLDENSDIHGTLQINVQNRTLPHLGYFGPDDVCFYTWLFELNEALKKLEKYDNAIYVFDECEQGQPAFEFKRVNDNVFISIIASSLGGGAADDSWQNIKCNFLDFSESIKDFTLSFKELLAKKISNDFSNKWFKQFEITI